VFCAKLDHAPGYRCIFCETRRVGGRAGEVAPVGAGEALPLLHPERSEGPSRLGSGGLEAGPSLRSG
jgi:hypothetical protein